MADTRRYRLLIVEDEPSSALLFEKLLTKEGYDVLTVETGQGALDHLATAPPDVMILDLGLPDMDGASIIDAVAAAGVPTSIIVATTNASLNVAIETMKRGAQDFLVKPVGMERLRVTVRNALERQDLRAEVAALKESLPRVGFQGFVGESPQMQAVYRAIEAAAATKASVMILGESGTGKEVCAEAIHKAGSRANKPFVALNCAALPRDLIESEIFGHVRGAFTGATADRTGAAALARGGTLFLDEIGEMQIDLQAKLLRFLQTGTFRKLGATKEETSDARIICATNRDPVSAIEEGRLREDLYYRLCVIPIELPPLNLRGGDILLLADHFLTSIAAEEGKSFTGFSPEAKAMLLNQAWPGNVRQLRNAIHNVVVMQAGGVVEGDMLPLPKAGLGSRPKEVTSTPESPPSATLSGIEPGQAANPSPTSDDGVIQPLHLVERQAIETAITHCDGNIPKAAALLGINPSTIYRKKAGWKDGPEEAAP